MTSPGRAAIFNASFAYAWTAIQQYGTAFALQEVAEGDTRCAAAIATQNDPTDLTGVVGQTNPYVDSLDRYTEFLNPQKIAAIDVPVLTQTAWQDEQLVWLPTYAWDLLDPENDLDGGHERHPRRVRAQPLVRRPGRGLPRARPAGWIP